MTMNNKGLGRGLDVLFNNQATDENITNEDGPFRYLPLTQVIPNPNQPRHIFAEESLKDLAESIRSKGVLQPILVRPTSEPNKWQIVAGERRWRAAKIAGLTEIPAVIRQFNDSDTMIAAIMENIHREDLNPIERAQGMEAIRKALNISQVDLANYLGMQRSTVNTLLRLLTLDPETREALISGQINTSHGRVLVTLPAPQAAILRDRIIELGMSVRGAELASAFWHQEKRFPWEKPHTEKTAKSVPNPDIISLAKKIGKILNCRAQINGTQEKGRINLTYDSNEQLFELLEKLGLSLDS